MEAKYKYDIGEPTLFISNSYNWYCDLEKDWHYQRVDGEWVLRRKNNNDVDSEGNVVLYD